jgi:hypothetical protein
LDELGKKTRKRRKMMDWNNLGTVMHCPRCQQAFDPATCKVSDDPHFDLYEAHKAQPKPGADTASAAHQRQWVLAEHFPATTWDAPEKQNYIKCGTCGRIEPMAGWLLDHKFNNPYDQPDWPTAVELITDDVGAKPRADQQRMAERTAKLDEIGDEEKI